MCPRISEVSLCGFKPVLNNPFCGDIIQGDIGYFSWGMSGGASREAKNMVHGACTNIRLKNSLDFRVKYRVIQKDCRGHTQYTPDATPCDFFLWGYVKDQVYVPPLPASIPELKVRIRTANETITADIRNEIDYRVDVCRITMGAHIESTCKVCNKNLECCSITFKKIHILLSQVYCV